MLLVQVLVCKGETGSGKTTQLPQYLFDGKGSISLVKRLYTEGNKLDRQNGRLFDGWMLDCRNEACRTCRRHTTQVSLGWFLLALMRKHHS